MTQEVDNIARASRKVTGMTQVQFCKMYDINVWTFRGWEQGRRDLDQHSTRYLRLITRNPVLMAKLIEEDREEPQSSYPQAEGAVDNQRRTRNGSSG